MAPLPHPQPEFPGTYKAYDHIHWYVGNAKQAASYYITRMGFHRIAYKGLETGSRTICSHVIRNGDVTFVLTSPLRPPPLDQQQQQQKVENNFSFEEKELLKEVHKHIEQHGDAVKDVAFEVDSVDSVFDAALRNGAEVVSRPHVLMDDNDDEGKGKGKGKDKGEELVKVATIKTYGETTHTLIERGEGYSGVFLPGYREVNSRNGEDKEDPISRLLPDVGLLRIDHCVGNQDWDEMERVCE